MKLYDFLLCVITIFTVNIARYIQEADDLQYKWYIDLFINVIIVTVVVGIAALVLRKIRVLREKEISIALSTGIVFIITFTLNMF